MPIFEYHTYFLNLAGILYNDMLGLEQNAACPKPDIACKANEDKVDDANLGKIVNNMLCGNSFWKAFWECSGNVHEVNAEVNMFKMKVQSYHPSKNV